MGRPNEGNIDQCNPGLTVVIDDFRIVTRLGRTYCAEKRLFITASAAA